MSQSKQRRFPTFLIVLLAAVGLTAVFILIPPNREEVSDKLLPWNSHYNQANQLEALGLVLNQSTPNDAKKLFGNDVEVKIFSKKDESGKAAEVYFPSMNIATIRGAVALSLDVSKEELDRYYSQGVQTTVTQTGNRQVTPNSENIEKLMAKPIKLVTLIPRKNLTKRAIEMRFGQPQRVEKQSDGLEHWFYPDKGLEVLYDEEGPDALQYGPSIQ